jgi:hypothetical protein
VDCLQGVRQINNLVNFEVAFHLGRVTISPNSEKSTFLGDRDTAMKICYKLYKNIILQILLIVNAPKDCTILMFILSKYFNMPSV